MRDWKVFRPDSGGSGKGHYRGVRQRSGSVNPEELDEPPIEIALDMDADQLTLMFDEAVKYEQRAGSGTASRSVDHQEEWRQEAIQAKAEIAKTFGPWTDESRLEGTTYYRKSSRLR